MIGIRFHRASRSAPPGTTPSLKFDGEFIMQDGVNEPLAPPMPSSNVANRRTTLLLGVGGTVGLTLGVLLTVGAYSTYTLFTQTLPSTVESVQVFNELNELRQQINQQNEEKKLLAKETEEAMRKALEHCRVRRSAPGRHGVRGRSRRPRLEPREAAWRRPFADIDAAIEDLERRRRPSILFSTCSRAMPRSGQRTVRTRNATSDLSGVASLLWSSRSA